MANNNNNKYQEEVAIPISPRNNEQSPLKGLQKTEFEAKPTNHSPQSSEISLDNSSPKKPPLYPTPASPLIRRRSAKKSRFGEPSIPIDSQTLEILGDSPKNSFNEKTPKKSSEAKEKEKQKEGPDEEEIYKRITAQLKNKNKNKKWRMTIKLVLELFIFLSILTCLVGSLYVKGFKGKLFFGVEVWKLFALLLVIFFGMLVAKWIVHCIVFLIEWKFLLKKNVVYFTHALQTNVVVFLWIAVVLITWIMLFKHGSENAMKVTGKMKKILDHITWTIVTLLIGSFLWLVKTTLIKILAASFHLNRLFDRIQEAVFHHYVLQRLSGKPLLELAHQVSREDSHGTQVSFRAHTGDHTEKRVVDWGKLHQMKQERVPSWTMKLLVDVISHSGLSTISSMLNKDVVEGGVALDDNVISCEEEAIATAVRIFKNVVGDKDKYYIDKKVLLRFMISEEVDLVYPCFEVNEKEHVDVRAFSQWVVRVYKDRQALKYALDDNKTAVDELNKLSNGILTVIILILWLLLTEIVTTKLLLFFSSQLLVAVFVFGNTCRTVFEAIIFVFVMHPFDVGDRCVIDGIMMVVEEMHILTTVFLKFDNEKICYPNAILSTKSIGNYHRSPDQGDCVNFGIDYATSVPKIAKLKERIKEYLRKTHFWHPEHNLVVNEIENINKIKMSLYFTHKMNFQDFPEKSRRRTELVLELKNIFDDLEISYHLLPQEVHLTRMV